MTLNELAYSILGLLRGDYKDNDYLDIRLIYYFIHTQRANWLAKELSKPYPNLEAFEQDLGMVEVETISSIGYVSLPASSNIKQTVPDIPKPFFKKGMPLITRVGSLDTSEPAYDFMTMNKAVMFGNGKFNSNNIAAFYDNKKIKLKSTNPLLGGVQYINIRGIFENPTDLKAFTLPDGTHCYNVDSEYPISADLIDYLHGDIIKYKLQLLVNTVNDKLNDGTITIADNTQK